ncbi:MAG: c-type cytochrome, partial [Akkermansiaceae bacterium]|nr:c-type cytochrome [Akkermansiaceae bacterium]
MAMARTTRLEGLADSVVWFVGREPGGRDELVKYFQEAPAERLARGLELVASSFPSSARLPAPAGWAELVARRRSGETAAVFDRLGAVFGDREIAARMAKAVRDRSAPLADRKNAFAFLAGRGDVDSSGVFVDLLDDPDFRSEVIPLLGRYNEGPVGKALLERLPKFNGKDRLNALNALCAQPVLARANLEAIKAQQTDKGGLTSLHLRTMRNLGDEEVNRLIDELWGRVAESSADMKASIEKYRAVFAKSESKPTDRAAGREVFAKACVSCHVLNGEGGKLGPDLTGSWRN